MPVYKRTINGKNQYRVRIGYTDVYGDHQQYQSKWFNLKKEAVEHEAEFLKNIKSYSKCTMTFKQVFDECLKDYDGQIKKKSYNEKLSVIKNYVPDQMMDRRISNITTEYIKKNVFSTERINTLGTSRKNKIYDTINGIFKHAVIYNGLGKNPMEPIPRFKKTDDEKLKEFNIYDEDEFDHFYHSFPSKYKKYADFMFILFWTGMRLNECRSLTFSSIKNNTIYLKKQLDPDGSWTTLKWNSQRKIVLNNACMAIINANRDEYSLYHGFSTDWFVFGGYRPFSPRTIERVKNDVIKENNLKYIRIHDLRHSHASYLIEKGVNIYKISKRLGHSSISITLDRYGHLLDSDDEILNAIS